jgi:hypothetical protein
METREAWCVYENGFCCLFSISYTRKDAINRVMELYPGQEWKRLKRERKFTAIRCRVTPIESEGRNET